MKALLKVFICSIALAFLAAGPRADAQERSRANYTAAEAKQHIGENATVTDKVDGVHQSGKGNIFLNMGGKYPNQLFTAFIPAASAAQFSGVQQYQGRTVAVFGKIALYRGKPEIIVTSPSQIITK